MVTVSANYEFKNTGAYKTTVYFLGGGKGVKILVVTRFHLLSVAMDRIIWQTKVPHLNLMLYLYDLRKTFRQRKVYINKQD